MLLGTGCKRGTVGRGQERVERGKTASRGEKRTSRSRMQGGNRRRTGKGGQGGSGLGESGTGRNKRAVRSRGGAVREGVTVYGPHKVRGKWRRYVKTVEEMIEQQDGTGHVTRAVIVQWDDQGKGDEERLPYPVERLQVCPQGREMEIHGQLVPEQEARELEGGEVSTGRRNKKQK